MNIVTFTLESLASNERKSMLLISERIKSLERKEQNVGLAKKGKEAQEMCKTTVELCANLYLEAKVCRQLHSDGF